MFTLVNIAPWGAQHILRQVLILISTHVLAPEKDILSPEYLHFLFL